MKSNAFTLVEVVIALCIFALLSLAFISSLNFSLNAHMLSQERNQLTMQGENALEKTMDDLKRCKYTEITPNQLIGIEQSNSDADGKYDVKITQATIDHLYIIKIIFLESRYESLCTQVHIP